MKKIITLMIMALLFTLKAIASVDIPTEYYSTVGEGTFAFYDVENKQFITSGVNADTPEFLTPSRRMWTTSISANSRTGLTGVSVTLGNIRASSRMQLFDDVETPEEMLGIPGSGFEMKLLGL